MSNNDKDAEKNPWKDDEVSWSLEENVQDKEANTEDGGRFDEEDIPQEPDEERTADTRLKIGVVVAVLAVLATAYLGAAVVADNGNADTGFETNGDGEEEAVNATVGDAEDGVVALPFEAGATGGDQRLRLVNRGDELRTSELDVVVELPGYGKNATVTNLPTNRLEKDENIEGDDMFDRSFGGVGGAATEETWQEDELVLRVKHGDEGAELSPGDKLRVKVVHLPTEEAVFSETLEAE